MQQQIRAFKSKREVVITNGIFLKKKVPADTCTWVGFSACMSTGYSM